MLRDQLLYKLLYSRFRRWRRAHFSPKSASPSDGTSNDIREARIDDQFSGDLLASVGKNMLRLGHGTGVPVRKQLMG
jgi:hypothetical protein